MEDSLKQKIITLRKQGLTYKEIQNDLDCSMGTISYHCRKNNLDNYNNFVAPTEKEKKEMQKIYNETNSSIKVAKITGWSKTTVLRYIETNKNFLTEEEIKKNKSNSVVSWRKRTKIKLVEYKGGKCQYCGYNKCIDALEFHHLDKKEKDFTISGKSWSFEKIKKETDKCVMVCSNCHKEIHAGLIEI